MTYATAQELARKTVEGRGTWDAFEQAASAMHPQHQRKSEDDRQRMQETWSLVEPAYTSMMKALGLADAGLSQMSTRMAAAESRTRLSSPQLARWASRVLDHVVGQMSKFRQGSAETPSFTLALSDRESAFTFDAHANALDQRRKEREEDTRRDRDRDRDRGGDKDKDRDRRRKGDRDKDRDRRNKGKGGGGKGDKGGKGAGGDTSKTGWTEKQVAIPEDQYLTMKRAAQTRFPTYCSNWLLGSCQFGSKCRFKHGPRPETFPTFIDEQGLKMDGNAKCAQHPASHIVVPCVSPQASSVASQCRENESQANPNVGTGSQPTGSEARVTSEGNETRSHANDAKAIPNGGEGHQHVSCEVKVTSRENETRSHANDAKATPNAGEGNQRVSCDARTTSEGNETRSHANDAKAASIAECTSRNESHGALLLVSNPEGRRGEGDKR